MRRDHRPGVAQRQAVGREGAQGLREHLLADALGPAPQLAPAQRLALGQRQQHQHAPLAGDVVEQGAAGARSGKTPSGKISRIGTLTDSRYLTS